MLNVPATVPRFAAPAQVIDAPGSLAALRGLDAAAVAVVARSHTAAAAALRYLRASRVEHLVPSWHGEPTLEGLSGTLAALESLRPDWIVAIGGGSVIDGAKLAWVRYEHPEQDFVARRGVVAVSRLRSRSRFIAVPTTTGSGSEMSGAAVFSTNGGAKCACVSPELVPDVAILDARLLANVPPRALGAAMMDALAHAVEGYTSRITNGFLDPMALGAAETIASHAAAITRPDDVESRQVLLRAAAHAGLVQNHRIPGLGHAIAHQLSHAGVGHAEANAILLPAVIRCNAADAAVALRYGRLAQACGFGDTAACLADGIAALRARLDLPATLTAASRQPLDRPLIVSGALEDVCARGNPLPVTPERIADVLDATWN